MASYKWGNYVFENLSDRNDSNEFIGSRIVTLNGREIVYPIGYGKTVSLSATFYQPTTRVVGSMSSGLASARTCGIGPNNSIYVADNTTGQIKQISANGIELTTLTVQGSNKDIRGVAHDGSNIWVALYTGTFSFDLCKLNQSGIILVRYNFAGQTGNISGLTYKSPYLYVLTDDGLIQRVNPTNGTPANVILLDGYDSYAGLTIVNGELCAGGIFSVGFGFLFATDNQIIGGTYLRENTPDSITGMAYVSGRLFVADGSSVLKEVRLNTVDLDVYKFEKASFGSYVVMTDDMGNQQYLVVTDYNKNRLDDYHLAYQIKIEARLVNNINPL